MRKVLIFLAGLLIGAICCGVWGYRRWLRHEVIMDKGNTVMVLSVYKALATRDITTAKASLERMLAIHVIALNGYYQDGDADAGRILGSIKRVFSNAPPDNCLLQQMLKDGIYPESNEAVGTK